MAKQGSWYVTFKLEVFRMFKEQYKQITLIVIGSGDSALLCWGSSIAITNPDHSHSPPLPSPAPTTTRVRSLTNLK